jgi:hypothetical protein
MMSACSCLSPISRVLDAVNDLRTLPTPIEHRHNYSLSFMLSYICGLSSEAPCDFWTCMVLSIAAA